MEIGTLIKELERQKETSLDLIVDSRSLKAAPDGEEVVELERTFRTPRLLQKVFFYISIN